jgi:hypothetical protein
MSGSGISVANMLCDLVDLLRKQHRAGITPSFGQVEELFELSDRLRANVAASEQSTEQAFQPTCAICQRADQLGDVIFGVRYCREHQRALAEVARYVSRAVPGAMPQQARTDWPAGESQLVGAAR